MHTDDELIQRALEIREDIDAMKKTHGEELEPYEVALQDIENSLLGRMVERQAKSIGTVHGTAYQSHQLRVKVVDRSAFLSFVFDKRLVEFLTNHVSKEQVKEYMEVNNGLAPPGVETTTFVQCNIRKA